MKKFTLTEALEDLCKRTKQWCLYLSWCTEWIYEIVGSNCFEELKKAAPFLDVDDTLCDKTVIFCDTEEELYNLFDQVVGDDGPTEKNSYDGPARVYALTIGPDGMESENT